MYAHVEVQESGCIIWTGTLNPQGYGLIRDGKMKGAHRVAWVLANGPIPDGLWVLHHCDNPPCINTEHLFLGTRQDNIDDKVQKNRSSRLTGETNPAHKLTEGEVLEIRQNTEGLSRAALARKYNISHSQVYKVINRWNWRKVGAA